MKIQQLVSTFRLMLQFSCSAVSTTQQLRQRAGGPLRQFLTERSVLQFGYTGEQSINGWA
jgi:hypothetical protein